MKITFSLPYDTVFGETLSLHIVNATAPEEQQETVYGMNTADGHLWTCLIDTAGTALPDTLDYYFTMDRGGQPQRQEWRTVMHRLDLDASVSRMDVACRWQDMPCDSYLYSAAFTQCVNRRPPTPLPVSGYRRTLRLTVRAPQLRCGMRLWVCGACKALGQWLPAQAVPMYEHNVNEWVADLDATAFDSRHVELKFGAVNEQGEHLWETGYNRHVDMPGQWADGDVAVRELDQAFFELCDEKLAGTLVPVFSLRTEGSFGVGDFGDLKRMVDWVADTHQRVLQVLPVNDTTSTHTHADSYPYSCISVFALHPQYADLRQLPALKDRQQARHFEQLRSELNALPQIDYDRMEQAKTEYLHLVFEQAGEAEMHGPSFRTFFSRNSHWLVPYAQFCLLRDRYGTAQFDRWPDHRQWDEADREALSTPRTPQYAEAAYHYWVQYVLYRQLRDAHDYARARGVILKGDIPIGVCRNGCDVWHEPQYFNLDAQAGAPPDAFAVNGQNWGFPTYNWQRMLDDGCRWWIRRFRHMALYFDAYRIDHVLGFFRIWSIPAQCVHALTGQFDPALPLTRQEIEAYGLHFDEQRFTAPFMPRWAVNRVFGPHAERVMATYLRHLHDDLYALQPDYDTQRKIEAAFKGRDSRDDSRVRDGLYALSADVLFVRDRWQKDRFHPRITAQLTFVYSTLSDKDKERFNALYNDYYYRRNSHFWYNEAMKKLPVLVQATQMLTCAEDLGMVPECVGWVMQQLRILSLELQAMPKEPGQRFGHLSHNPYRSVCTLSTHDMPTLRQWWDEDRERTQDFYTTMLYRAGNAPHPLPGWLARDIIDRQLASPSMLCILALQDWLAMDEQLRLPDAAAERINIPADPHHYWRYRMHLTIEQLLKQRGFNDSIKELVDGNGR